MIMWFSPARRSGCGRWKQRTGTIRFLIIWDLAIELHGDPHELLLWSTENVGPTDHLRDSVSCRPNLTRTKSAGSIVNRWKNSGI